MKLTNVYLHTLTKETKSKRLQLLCYPSLISICKNVAIKRGESLNEFINNALAQYLVLIEKGEINETN